ncbi:MAG: hypothetical protein JSR86_09255 [Proteobacteria bacterium]|nr:hypothetical protein [Pseudomonadota bacterium]
MAWSDLWRVGGMSRAQPRRAPISREPDHAYLCIRSVAADGQRHLMQYAVADDLGSVLLSAFVRTDSPVGYPDAAARAAVEAGHALDSQGLAAAMRLCRGLRLTAFGAGLSRGLLPPEVSAGLAGLDCARERFLKVARRQGLRLAPGEPADLNEARRLVGLPPERSEDAALRALALGGLCRWMSEHAPLAERRTFLG